MREIREWASLIWAASGRLMTGSLIVALIIAVAGTIWQGAAFLGVFFATLIVCLAIASYNVWKNERREKQTLSSRLLPKIELLDNTERHGSLCQILIHNLCDCDLQYGVQVEKLNPSMPGLPQ